MRQKNTKIILSITVGLMFIICITAVQASYWQTSILPDVSDWPQHQDDSGDGSWCGVAALQAKIDWDWREHHNDYTHFYTQEELWDYARDHTSSDISIKGVQGRDEALPGVVGNGWTQVRKLNISYDFGIDPHAVAWLLWKYGPSYYHYWIYDDVDQATWALLWTLENYHEPVPTAVWAGSHWVLTIGYHALQSATSNDGLGEIYAIYYADPLPSADPTTYEAFKWKTYADWENYFTVYANSNDPDPSTGWYTPPPDHWYGHWVTVERDDKAGYSPDWAMGINGPIMPNYFPSNIYLPLVLKNWPWSFTETFYPARNPGWILSGATPSPNGRTDAGALYFEETASAQISISVPANDELSISFWCKDTMDGYSYPRIDLYLDGEDVTPGSGANNILCYKTWTYHEYMIDNNVNDSDTLYLREQRRFLFIMED